MCSVQKRFSFTKEFKAITHFLFSQISVYLVLIRSNWGHSHQQWVSFNCFSSSATLALASLLIFVTIATMVKLLLVGKLSFHHTGQKSEVLLCLYSKKKKEEPIYQKTKKKEKDDGHQRTFIWSLSVKGQRLTKWI